jgi:hypothetical protein
MTRNGLTSTELTVLSRAECDGWLTLTADIRDVALIHWQRECRRCQRSFAVLRLEPQRASLWFVLAEGREWAAREQAQARDALRSATGIVLTPRSAQAFVTLGNEVPVMAQLLNSVGR